MLVSFAQRCQGIPVRDRLPKTGNIADSPRQIARMELPTGQLDTLKTDAAALLEGCADAAQPGGTGDPDDSDLAMLVQGFEQLLDVIARAESDLQAGGSTGSADITELGVYAQQLIESLAARIGQSGTDESRRQLAAIHINIALWIARQGGVIDTLEPIVDALAYFANTSRDPDTLADLCGVIGKIVAAVSPVITQDLAKANPGRPWRVLLLNQSIVATRSHNAGLMEQTFALLTNSLPEDAGQFFTEGMQQMDALNYPEHVRAVMAKYHRQWNIDRSLH